MARGFETLIMVSWLVYNSFDTGFLAQLIYGMISVFLRMYVSLYHTFAELISKYKEEIDASNYLGMIGPNIYVYSYLQFDLIILKLSLGYCLLLYFFGDIPIKSDGVYCS